MALRTVILAMAVIMWAQTAAAHFGVLTPSRSMAMTKSDAAITLTAAFSHPFSRQGMEMKKPREFFVAANGKKTDLLDSLKPAEFLGAPAFSARYDIARPGVYQFGIVPEPYFEPAEDCFIIHYAKTAVGAFGGEDGWEKPLGLPVEIVPLSRPFGNYAGNIFTGKAIKDGQPLANAVVETEFLNDPETHAAPNAYFETQTVVTDKNGVFSFGIPWAGWWGFAVLTSADAKMRLDGKDKDVELGGVIWLRFDEPALK